MAEANDDTHTPNDEELCEETNVTGGEIVLEEDLESDKEGGQQLEEDKQETGEDDNNAEEKVDPEPETKHEEDLVTEEVQEEKQQLELEQVETTSTNIGMPDDNDNNDPGTPEEGSQKDECCKIKEHEAPEKGKVSKIKSMWLSGQVYNQASNVKEKDSSYKKEYGVGQERAPVDKTAYEKQ